VPFPSGIALTLGRQTERESIPQPRKFSLFNWTGAIWPGPTSRQDTFRVPEKFPEKTLIANTALDGGSQPKLAAEAPRTIEICLRIVVFRLGIARHSRACLRDLNHEFAVILTLLHAGISLSCACKREDLANDRIKMADLQPLRQVLPRAFHYGSIVRKLGEP
jgi:hypothetical protein